MLINTTRDLGGNSQMERGFRLPRLIDATGERLSSSQASASFELIRHGFASWGGIKDTVSCDPMSELALHLPASETFDMLDMVACRHPEVLYAAMSTDQPTGVLFVGTPLSHADSQGSVGFSWPTRLPFNVDLPAVAWLGAPGGVNLMQDLHDARFITDDRSLSPHTIMRYLTALENLWLHRSIARGFVVLNLDGMHSLAPHGRDGVGDEVFAAALRWAQQARPFDASLIFYSEGALSATRAKLMGDIARNLGQSLYRYAKSARRTKSVKVRLIR